MIQAVNTQAEAHALNDIDEQWKIVGRRQLGAAREWVWNIPYAEQKTFKEFAFRASLRDQEHYSICTGRNGSTAVLYARIYPLKWRSP